MYLELQQLSVQYPGQAHPAVNQVSFGLKAGQIGVLIGPSGCGKTTLLRATAGLEPIHAGNISLSGALVSSPTQSVPPEARHMGMVFQDYALFPHLDVGQNVAFGIHHWPTDKRRARVADVLDLVGLGTQRRRYPHELSGGQQQRVALARALAPSPKLLLLDEPFSNLDVDLRERLAQELRTILKEAGATALFVTHDQLEAFAIGDLIGVMHEGRLHQWADAYTLYHRPATRFVADFIGHGVFAPARVELHEENGVTHKHVVTPLGELHGINLAEQDRLTLGPCDVLLRADDIVHDDAATVQAKIINKAFRGNEFLYTLQLKTGETVMAHVPSHHDHRLGEWIGIRPEVDHVVTFACEPASS
ncbi:ABC transporter ATP-binding protein [Rhodoferax saidenbachensis]|uniref:ABC transporter ATP-binding protein n=1 Tax=Rhodoferax saidenbachensis TaxID=1484693 RepID=A0A1P8K7J9_9BURK|nr:ABC transporter ATP-binding protein [Rhodoferax saidenbachensis]APW41980.1 ABC transporter ATP-binding protein [Rhodoferax saidenbachensis]